jgi:hypothetical protein
MLPEETYVRRVEREIRDLFVLFKRNWLVGLVIVLVGALYLGIKVIPEKKPDSSALAERILEQARAYQTLVEEHKRILENSKRTELGAKEQQISKLQADLVEAKRRLHQTAQKYAADLRGSVSANSAASGTLTTTPSSVVEAWTRCIEAGSTPAAAPACDQILQQGVFDVSGSRQH